MITSKTNSRLKTVRKLMDSSKARIEAGMFVAEGERLCSEVPENLLDSVFMSEEYYKRCDCRYKNFEIVDNTVFKSLSDTVNPQGIMAIVRMPRWEEPEFETSSGRKILLLDGIRDPGNLGTIIRTAEAADIAAVYMSRDCVDLYNPKVIRSTMGSIFRVPAMTRDLENVITELKGSGIKVYATSLNTDISYKDADLSGSAIIIGSEANGVKPQILSAASGCIKIPMAGRVESLNAAVSAAVLMFS